MRFLPYGQSATVPNIIVDGARNEKTVLALSHWPKSGCPAELKADTSTAIVFNYLDSPRFHVEADVVSNDHFDEDRLAGVFAMRHPAEASRHRELLIDVAQAGDFGIYSQRHAARISFVLSAYANPKSSPLPSRILNLPYPEMASALYIQLLDLLPGMLMSVEDYRTLWEKEDASLTESEKLFEDGVITIEEQPELDLAIVRLPENETCHPFALNNRTSRTRILLLQGKRAALQYRYESWVQLVSRRPAARVDLSELARKLNQEESSDGRWVFDGVDQITPKLHFVGTATTSQPLDGIMKRIQHHLKIGRPAWNPYD